jgi:hypothetical protein
MPSKCENILALLERHGPKTVSEINEAFQCKDASARCAELFKRGKIIDVEPTRNRRVWGLATDANKCHAAVQEGVQEVRRSQEADLLNGPPTGSNEAFVGLEAQLDRAPAPGPRPKEWHIVVRDGGPFGEMGTAYRIKKVARQAATNVKGELITVREV